MPTDKIKSLCPKKMDRILKAAVKEFASNSFKDASFNKIIREAGIGKGTLYYYFESKSDLFLTITAGASRCLEKSIILPPSPKNSDEFWQQLEGILTHAYEFQQEEPWIAKFLYQLIITEENQTNQSCKEYTAFKSWFADLISMGQKVEALRTDLPQGLLSAQLLGQLRSVVDWLLENDTKRSTRHKAQITCELLARSSRMTSFSSHTDPTHDQDDLAYCS